MGHETMFTDTTVNRGTPRQKNKNKEKQKRKGITAKKSPSQAHDEGFSTRACAGLSLVLFEEV